MTVESINVGDPATIRVGPRTVVTGIEKQPVPRARVHRLGLQGDTVANEEDQGGPDQAVGRAVIVVTLGVNRRARG